MKTIAFTQRVEKITKYKETRDCLDQRWIELALKLKLKPQVLPNIDPKKINNLFDNKKPNLIVLTGGNDLIQKKLKFQKNTSIKRDNFEKGLIRFAIKEKIPLIGVCRGMQILNNFFKGKITPITNHVNKNHKLFFSNDYKKYFNNEVNSFHNWGIKKNNLGLGLKPIAFDKSNNVECFIHLTNPIMGLMWHPERKFSKKNSFIFKELINRE